MNTACRAYILVVVAVLWITSPAYAQQQADLFVRFAADTIGVDHKLGVISARGDVRAAYGRRALTADAIQYHLQTNTLSLLGNVSLQGPSGDVVSADFIILEGDFKHSIVLDIQSIISTALDDNFLIAAGSSRHADEDSGKNLKPSDEKISEPPFLTVGGILKLEPELEPRSHADEDSGKNLKPSDEKISEPPFLAVGGILKLEPELELRSHADEDRGKTIESSDEKISEIPLLVASDISKPKPKPKSHVVSIDPINQSTQSTSTSKGSSTWYVSAGGGVSQMSELDSEYQWIAHRRENNAWVPVEFVNHEDRRMASGESINLRVGYKHSNHPHLRAELEFMHSQAHVSFLHDYLDKVDITGQYPNVYSPHSIFKDKYPADMKLDSYMLNAYWDFDKHNVGPVALTPYVGAGLGITDVNYLETELDVAAGQRGGYYITTATINSLRVSSQLKMGLKIDIAPGISLSQEYSYLHVPGGDLDSAFGRGDTYSSTYARAGEFDPFGVGHLMVLMNYDIK